MREPEYTKRVEIDGVIYGLQKFTARKSLNILTRLFKLIGEPVSTFAGAMEKDFSLVLPVAVKALADRLDESETVSLIEELLKGVTIGGGSQQPTLDSHFQGQIGHLFKLMAEALKFQYGDFFDVLGSLSPAKLPGAKVNQRAEMRD